MMNITITESDDFKVGSGKVQFDYLVLKTNDNSLVGETIRLSEVKKVDRVEECTEGMICFEVEFNDERKFIGSAVPQIYSKLSIGSDPIKRIESPPMREGGGVRSALRRGVQKVYNAITCGTCGNK